MKHAYTIVGAFLAYLSVATALPIASDADGVTTFEIAAEIAKFNAFDVNAVLGRYQFCEGNPCPQQPSGRTSTEGRGRGKLGRRQGGAKYASRHSAPVTLALHAQDRKAKTAIEGDRRGIEFGTVEVKAII